MEVGLEEHIELLISMVTGTIAIFFFLGFLKNTGLAYNLQNIIDFFITSTCGGVMIFWVI